MRFRFDVEIQAHREEVFDFLGDPANRPKWQSSLQSIEMEPQGSLRVGITWRESVRGIGAFDMEISEFDRPTRWAERIRSRAFSGIVRLTFADDGDKGTRVTLETDVRCHGLWRLVDPIGSFFLRRAMRKDLMRVNSLL